MTPELLQPIVKHASIISKGDKDLSQNILGMCLKNYQNALQKGKHLSIGENVNFLKNRAKELKSGKRNYFGNNSSYSGKDVYRKSNYYSGVVEIHSINYFDDADHCEDEADGKGMIIQQMAVKDVFENIAFNIDFKRFLRKLHSTEKQILDLKVAGYSYKEISNTLKLSYDRIKSLLNDVIVKFIKFFEIDEENPLGI